MTEYTPGKWAIGYDNTGNGGFCEWWNVEADDEHIAKVAGEANARLIAAAPDMLEALVAALAPFNEPTRNPSGNPVGEPSWCAKARAALAKARPDARQTVVETP